MPVKDFMTKKLVYVSPDTTVAEAADLLREHHLRRLPVVENDQLVGLVTEGTMAEAQPSKAISLSIYEMNYLLNKTKIRDIMIKDIVTVSQYASLEDAIYLMMSRKIGVLPVVDNGQLYGIVTDRDVFKAFLEIAGYGQEGYRLVILADEGIGVLSKVLNRLSSANLSVKRLVIIERKAGKKAVEIQLEGYADKDVLKQELVFDDVIVETLEKTVKKPLS
ncbi:CBS domain-containing protein [Streptococcus agalactiae]|uniref:CBS domain-containing protein n=1 Tax=Streptococcus agalactiae TaxID=1311 RepID=UPI0006402D33|nr:CBS domain-containing protein [Streptococcus agalactiae]KLJ33192.1 acetoin utilization protein [Streptococcus agalactiae]KLJ77059.1 acetoin utilization protein [Streptococcus agalactiae]KLJ79477.1 acetoin utilization protein [Streptococcus agalactiae]KLJ87498.1 acetoin utilization protein [Streptococcus agalactiae]KLK12950.1 acetoin utilization protein [Streptococcus agalactiae]